MKKIINLYSSQDNEYVGQLFLKDPVNKQYNHLDTSNNAVGYALTIGSYIQIYNTNNQHVYNGQAIGNRIDFRNIANELIFYGLL